MPEEPMPDSTPTHTVAVFNASDDTVAMLAAMLSTHGYRAVTEHADHVKSGELNFIEFLKTHTPAGLIWDIAPPYDRNWNFFQLVRALGPLDRCAIVLTTTHKQHLDSLAGQETGAIEIVGKPYDLQMIVDAVARGIERRRSGGQRAFGQPRE
jgi:FixJ family two-component response regulator